MGIRSAYALSTALAEGGMARHGVYNLVKALFGRKRSVELAARIKMATALTDFFQARVLVRIRYVVV